jgi:N-glycosylase/DNA lyase
MQVFELKKSYEKKKCEINKRLENFKKVWEKSDKDIFVELCFCLLVPQSKARFADKAISNMVKKDILFSGNEKQILGELTMSSIRFPENKAKYIMGARKNFSQDGIFNIKNKLKHGSDFSRREWLVNNVNGFGYKLASHFLRNIGFGSELAILDRHVLKNLVKYKVITSIPKNLSKKQYLSVEEKMRKFSKKMDIPMADLDLLFWSEETGEIFK